MLHKLYASLGALALIVIVGALAGAQETAPTFIKNAMCIACHKSKDGPTIERYQETKHAKAAPAEGMSPVDIYRRTTGFKSADNSYYEKGIGCQACHGPGSAHLKAKTDEEKKAALRRVDRLEKPTQKLSVCGRCHGQYTIGDKPFAEGFKIGDDLYAMEGFKLAEITEPGPFQQLNELAASKHGEKDVTCVTCHTSHEPIAAAPQLRQKMPDLCLQCHGDAHKCTVKPEEIPAGATCATCATCHMPGGRHIFGVQK